jgi:hypothetical protein
MADHTVQFARDHIAKGLCIKCCRKAVPGIQLCEHHRELKKQHFKRCRERRRGLRLCTRCTLPLHEEMDQGYINCVSCRQEIGRTHV